MRTPPELESLYCSWIGEHRGILARVARSFAGSAAEAQDIEQEMMLQLWISLPSFRGQSKPSTWIYRVCLNTALTWRRGDSRRLRHVESRADLGDIASASATPAESAGDREILEKLYEAIRAIPALDRALVLLLLDGVSYHEMSEVTGMTENHVGVALTRARRRLAELMKGTTDELE
jgi:RNA polymerase sigma-70 factor (ECF subfamily)